MPDNNSEFSLFHSLNNQKGFEKCYSIKTYLSMSELLQVNICPFCST